MELVTEFINDSRVQPYILEFITNLATKNWYEAKTISFRFGIRFHTLEFTLADRPMICVKFIVDELPNSIDEIRKEFTQQIQNLINDLDTKDFKIGTYIRFEVYEPDPDLI